MSYLCKQCQYETLDVKRYKEHECMPGLDGNMKDVWEKGD